MMGRAPVFTAYCLLVLLGFTVARYQGWTLFGSAGLAASSGSTGGARGGGGSSGFHK